ncbi:MAG: copper-binding protein [Aquabacterium sp.]|nr:copper-binding protein [Aquabacterium sp.]
MNHIPFFLRSAGLAALLALSAAAMAPARAASPQGSQPAQADQGKPVAPADTGEMTDAEVRRVDKDGGKLTLRHADIKSLDMPAMTMVFVVRDKAMLDTLKPGDKIRFKAVNDAGKYTVTEIQRAQ